MSFRKLQWAKSVLFTNWIQSCCLLYHFNQISTEHFSRRGNNQDEYNLEKYDLDEYNEIIWMNVIWIIQLLQFPKPQQSFSWNR